MRVVGIPVGEYANILGAPAAFPVEKLVGAFGPDLLPDISGKGRERENVTTSVI